MANLQVVPIEIINRQVRLPQTVEAFYLEPPQIILTPYSTIMKHHVITTAICWTLGGIPSSIKRKIVAIPDNMKATFNQAIDPEVSVQVMVFLGMAGLITLGRIKDIRSNVKLENFLNRWKALCTTMGIEDIFATNKIPRKQVAKFICILESWQRWATQQADMRKDLLEMAIQESDANSPELVKQTLVQVKIDLEYLGLYPISIMDTFIDSGSQAMILPAIAQQAVNLRRFLNELKITVGEHRYKYFKIMELKGGEGLSWKNYPDLCFAALSATVFDEKQDIEEKRNILKQIRTTICKKQIQLRIHRIFATTAGIDKKTQENLSYLGIKPRSLRKRKKNENDNDGERAVYA